jgi:uncharacterized protein (DUF433 family)
MSNAAPSLRYPYITSEPSVRGGHAIVEGTRIGMHDVIGLLQTGETVESVVATCFPSLRRAQVYECLAYYEDHRGEIDVLIFLIRPRRPRSLCLCSAGLIILVRRPRRTLERAALVHLVERSGEDGPSLPLPRHAK